MAAADDLLRSYVGRILNVLDEIDALGEDKKAIYKEMADAGFDRSVASQLVGHLRKKAKKPGKFAEQSALFDLYLAAYEGRAPGGDEDGEETGTVIARVRTHAAREIPEHDADGVIIEPNSAPADSPPSAMVERATGTPSDGLHDAGEAAVAPQVEASPANILPPVSAAQTVTVQGNEPSPTSSPEHEAVESSGINSPAGEVAAAKSGEASVASPAPAAKKRWTFNDPAHRDCLDPAQCGGFSNLKLCERCRLAAAADVHLEAAE